ncbi:hypothetical protein C8J57DRAFT_1488405 [Mycena rebaudengoi]|nr:hypothetical protein C8J57DRAFT_1488405 [Mycena rebaudengoi]
MSMPNVRRLRQLQDKIEAIGLRVAMLCQRPYIQTILPQHHHHERQRRVQGSLRVIRQARYWVCSTGDARDLLRALGQNPTQAEVADIVRDAPADDGFKPAGTVEEFIRGFQVFDKEGNGFIGAGELRYVLTQLGEKMTDEEVNELLKGVQIGADGNVNLRVLCEDHSQSVGGWVYSIRSAHVYILCNVPDPTFNANCVMDPHKQKTKCSRSQSQRNFCNPLGVERAFEWQFEFEAPVLPQLVSLLRCMFSLNESQQAALSQLRDLTNGGDDDVGSPVSLNLLDWDVQRAAEMIFGTGPPPPSRNIPQFEVDDSEQGQEAPVAAPAPRWNLASILTFPFALLSTLLRFVVGVLHIPLPRPFAFNLAFFRPRRSAPRGDGTADRWVRELEEETGALCIGTVADDDAAGPSTSSSTLRHRGPERRVLPDLRAAHTRTSCAHKWVLSVIMVFQIWLLGLGPEFIFEPNLCGYQSQTTLTDPAFVHILHANNVVVWGGDVRDREAHSAALKLQATTYPLLRSSRCNHGAPLPLLHPHHPTRASPSCRGTRGRASTTAPSLTAHLTDQLLPRVTAIFAGRSRSGSANGRGRGRSGRKQDRRFADSARRDGERISALMEAERREARAKAEAEAAREREERRRAEQQREREKRRVEREGVEAVGARIGGHGRRGRRRGARCGEAAGWGTRGEEVCWRTELDGVVCVRGWAPSEWYGGDIRPISLSRGPPVVCARACDGGSKSRWPAARTSGGGSSLHWRIRGKLLRGRRGGRLERWRD